MSKKTIQFPKKKPVKKVLTLPPLTAADFPPGTALRHPSWPKEDWRMISAVSAEQGLVAWLLSNGTASGQGKTFQMLADEGWLRRLPGERWKPCVKV